MLISPRFAASQPPNKKQKTKHPTETPPPLPTSTASSKQEGSQSSQNPSSAKKTVDQTFTVKEFSGLGTDKFTVQGTGYDCKQQ